MHLSNRLFSVAAMVSQGCRLADVGTDHAYVPIYLVKKGVIPAAIAMDIRPGPLERAKEHIKEYEVETNIKTRLSDGVAALMPGEVDSLVIAGMGGNVMIHILQGAGHIMSTLSECILQPQSELAKFRYFLDRNGFKTVQEDMVEEDGKFYPIMRVIPPQTQTLFHLEEGLDLGPEFRYGRLLLENRHLVLKEFLEKERRKNIKIIQNMELYSNNGRERIQELQTEGQMIERALRYYS